MVAETRNVVIGLRDLQPPRINGPKQGTWGKTPLAFTKFELDSHSRLYQRAYISAMPADQGCASIGRFVHQSGSYVGVAPRYKSQSYQHLVARATSHLAFIEYPSHMSSL